MKYLRAVLAIISIIILVGASAAGCKSGVAYTTATATKGGISFSFEYPAGYVPYKPDSFQDTGENSVVALVCMDNQPDKNKLDREIVIGGFGPIPGRPDARAWTDEHIRVMTQGDTEFELYERSPVQISGIQGEMISYHTSILGSYLQSNDVVYRDAYLDYQGKIWKIALLTTADVADEARADFDQLVSTFKFLEN